MILTTYARLWADDLGAALPLLERLTGQRPALRFVFEGIELAAVGDFLVIAGPADMRARYAHATATVVVTDLDHTRAALEEEGARITTEEAASATGRFLYARHPGGAEVEYVEWTAEIRRKVLGPQADTR
ncbi:VOC family protein [Streptomyces lonarensis]|uniref:VOC family protein n=1 Tax=Streptomyces lonarensis TaxID=700599 RepID=A0A7X6CZK4_9ACTN|nr:VOC family protein [Streptomyces lonarensis]NJQ05422.1 VOC family protein [Streptomyces lonarensis]